MRQKNEKVKKETVTVTEEEELQEMTFEIKRPFDDDLNPLFSNFVVP